MLPSSLSEVFSSTHPRCWQLRSGFSHCLFLLPPAFPLSPAYFFFFIPTPLPSFLLCLSPSPCSLLFPLKSWSVFSFPLSSPSFSFPSLPASFTSLFLTGASRPGCKLWPSYPGSSILRLRKSHPSASSSPDTSPTASCCLRLHAFASSKAFQSTGRGHKQKTLLCLCHGPHVLLALVLWLSLPRSSSSFLLFLYLGMLRVSAALSCPMGYCNWSSLVVRHRLTQTGSSQLRMWISPARIMTSHEELNSGTP